MKYYIIAGEASGDLHASNLMQGIKDVDSQADFRFFGGDLMAKKGGTLVKHYREMAFMGFWEVLVNLRKISHNLNHCKKDIKTYNPDVVILVDYPGFNLRIAKFAKNEGFKVFYYIAPKVWAWKKSRVKTIKKFVDKLFVIFPFEVDFFRKHGIEVIYRGNPTIDAITSKPKDPNFISSNNLPYKPIIAVLCGSRVQEVKYNLPVMLSLENELKDYQLVVAGAPSLNPNIYSPYLKNTGVKIVCNQTQELLKHADVAMVTSGTATLEAALLNVPEVVCYRGNLISMLIAWAVIRIKYISLVNLIMNREVVKELIQYKLNSTSLLAEIQRILPGQEGHKQMLNDFLELKNALGSDGASARVAKEMFALVSK
jgi:lipid-A-disaccharide synthase